MESVKYLFWRPHLKKAPFSPLDTFQSDRNVPAKYLRRTPRRQNLQIRNQENKTLRSWLLKFKSERQIYWNSCTRDIASQFIARLNKPLWNLFLNFLFGKRRKKIILVKTSEIFCLLMYYQREKLLQSSTIHIKRADRAAHGRILRFIQ